jgi:predicted membrane protein
MPGATVSRPALRFSAVPLYVWQNAEAEMFKDPVFLIATVACFVVVAILAIGIGGFAKGGDFNRKYANKLMQLRIAAQAVAVLVIVLFAWARSR